MSYYPRKIRKVASTFLKSKMWKMWKPAWIAAYLRLKMWKIDLKVWNLWE